MFAPQNFLRLFVVLEEGAAALLQPHRSLPDQEQVQLQIGDVGGVFGDAILPDYFLVWHIHSR